MDNIPLNIITFKNWVTLKRHANLTKGFNNFSPEELDSIVVFLDGAYKYIDYLERREIEDITPAYVMLPRFFWETHKDTIPDEFFPDINIDKILKEEHTLKREYWHRLESMFLADKKFYECKFEPRPEQKPVIDFFIKKMQEEHRIHGVLQAAPGFGKTYVTINLLAGFRGASLIIVPNEVLAAQWLEAIVNFTDLKEEDIGIIQGSNLEKNQPEVDKVISIVKIQSLFSQLKNNKYIELQNFYKFKDFIIYDEVHTSGAATSYARTSSLFLTPNIIGLTATPYRNGINNYLLNTSVGPLLYRVEHQNLIPFVEIHRVYIPFNNQEQKRINMLKHDYNMALGVFNSLMHTKHDYFNYIADIINWNFQNGHNIVVLLPTIKLMEKLQKSLMDRHPYLNEYQILLKGKTKEDMQNFVKIERKRIMAEYKKFREELNCRVKNKEIKRKDANLKIKLRRKEIDGIIKELKEHAVELYRKVTKNARIIISNPNLLSAGYDDPKLSNLIIAGTPRIGPVPVIQSIGRVTRVYENKPEPLVQYFIPAPFYDINKSVNIILTNNIKKQYPEARIKYIGMENAKKTDEK